VTADTTPEVGCTMVYLIYSCYETPAKICGSLLLAKVETEEEAKTTLTMYKEQSDKFYKDFPLLDTGMRRHVYIHWPNPL